MESIKKEPPKVLVSRVMMFLEQLQTNSYRGYYNNVTIYPNPFDNEITIKVNAVKDQVVSIQLYSLTGQMLLDEKQDVVSGENLLKIQPRVSTGSYLLQIEINGEKVINKVMKK
jgi:hypothetical protein